MQSKLTKKERFRKIIEYFEANMQNADTELLYKSAYELLVAVVLSAQCTDKRVNMITPLFFEKFPDIKSLSRGTTEEIYQIIKSCSYPNSKSKHLLESARMIVSEFNGKIPSDIQLLQKLPGVGRKTANVIAAVYFKQPTMPVDTHVFRVSARIGLTSNAKTPLQAELQLVRHFPRELLTKAHHWLILHGRYVCTARKPKCKQCGISNYCKYYYKRVL